MDGWTVSKYFEDPDVSGGTPLNERPQGKKLLASLKSGDTIIAARLDRVFRDAHDALGVLKDMKTKGVNLILLDMGVSPVTENGTSRMFFGMLSLLAEWERERIGERIRDSKRHLRADGRYLGGPVPFGFKLVGKKVVPHPKHQQAIALMQSLRGTSLRKIAAKVKEEFSMAVSPVLVRRVLANGGRREKS